MSVNIHLVARRISDNSVVFDASLSRTESGVVWEKLGINTNAYPDSTGSVFRDMPGHLATAVMAAIAEPPALVSAFCAVLQSSSDNLNASMFWS